MGVLNSWLTWRARSLTYPARHCRFEAIAATVSASSAISRTR